MKCNPGTVRDRDLLLEDFAAELTEAAYPVALRHRLADSSIDLELALWRVLAETVKKVGRNARLTLK